MIFPHRPHMNFRLLLGFVCASCFAVNALFAQEEVDFNGDWEGVIKISGRSDSHVKISVQDGVFTQYYKREGQWSAIKTRNPYHKRYGDILMLGWINRSKVWTENQMFSLSYLGADKVKVMWTRHVTNRREGKENDAWSHRGEGELIRGGGAAMGNSVVGEGLLGKAFEIQRLGTDKQDAFVDGGWRNGNDCIEVKFSVVPDMKSRDVVLKAYFYDAAGNQIHHADYPSQISDSNQDTHTMPLNIDAGEKYTVFFAIPERFHRGSKKWRRVVVVLGDKQQVTAGIYPKDDISKFSFPEKGRMKVDKKGR